MEYMDPMGLNPATINHDCYVFFLKMTSIATFFMHKF